MQAGDLLRVAKHEVSLGARLAGVAVVAVPADADDVTLLKLLGRGVGTRLNDLPRVRW